MLLLDLHVVVEEPLIFIQAPGKGDQHADTEIASLHILKNSWKRVLGDVYAALTVD